MTSLEESVARWQRMIDRPAANGPELVANLQALYDEIFHADFSRFDVAALKGSAHLATEELFDLQLRVRDRLPEWAARGLMSHEAARAARDAIRVLRYATDIVGEVGSGFQRLAEGDSTHMAFRGPPTWTLADPGQRLGQRLFFRSGDVVLVRGRLHNSAAIARIGDIDSQFSHVGIVHVDQGGALWLVEALIEIGSTISALDDALAHGLGRAMLLRYRDRQMAARASKAIFDRVSASLGVTGEWIPYDFSMELEGEEALFCSKLVRAAYLEASAGTVVLPRYATRLDLKNRDFFERIGVTAVNTFAPGDFEVEPDFNVVAEWRDYRVTSSLRMQDLIMSKLFDWMDEHGYRFRPDLGIGAVSIGGRLSSWLPSGIKEWLSGHGVPRIPPNMSRSTIGAIVMLHKTAQPILEHLEALEKKHIADTGRPMHPREVYAELEAYRAKSPRRVGYLVAP
ncbi:MAG: YiiX/YebB-like N1pC/P60 family cysteine hydrolase [Hyphomicrobiaceae bacterium]